MTVEEEAEIADLRMRLVGLRLLLHARTLRALTGEVEAQGPGEDLVQTVRLEIAEVRARIDALCAAHR